MVRSPNRCLQSSYADIVLRIRIGKVAELGKDFRLVALRSSHHQRP